MRRIVAKVRSSALADDRRDLVLPTVSTLEITLRYCSIDWPWSVTYGVYSAAAARRSRNQRDRFSIFPDSKFFSHILINDSSRVRKLFECKILLWQPMLSFRRAWQLHNDVSSYVIQNNQSCMERIIIILIRYASCRPNYYARMLQVHTITQMWLNY